MRAAVVPEAPLVKPDKVTTTVSSVSNKFTVN